MAPVIGRSIRQMAMPSKPPRLILSPWQAMMSDADPVKERGEEEDDLDAHQQVFAMPPVQ